MNTKAPANPVDDPFGLAPENKLLLLLAATAAASVIHFADNIVRFAAYPEPAWNNARLTDAFWFIMTPVGVWAAVHCLRGRPRAAIPASYAYGAMNLVTLGHYLYAWPWEVSLVINATILVEVGTAAFLIAHTVSLHRALGPR